MGLNACSPSDGAAVPFRPGVGVRATTQPTRPHAAQPIRWTGPRRARPTVRFSIQLVACPVRLGPRCLDGTVRRRSVGKWHAWRQDKSLPLWYH